MFVISYIFNIEINIKISKVYKNNFCFISFPYFIY